MTTSSSATLATWLCMREEVVSMREYGIRKTETYYVRANSEEEARALVDEMDNSYAWSVNVEAIYASAEEEASA